jgi:UDP-GlcNAc:undecaprenyl-phosphate/decaprenyl-phosphate GlcNAc-1-phosphate transferase
VNGWVSASAQVALVAALTWLLPWAGIRMLAGSLAASPLAQRVNYRRQTVFVGLGIVWVFWVAGMVLLRYAGQAMGSALSVFVALGAVSPLVITTLLFGVIDDAYGSAGDRGFRGHLAALVAGRMTTGALKLLGIAFVSVAAATAIVGGSGIGTSSIASVLLASPGALLPWAAWTIALGAVIALSANLVNLTDLRPGRALKFYGVCAGALVVGAYLSAATSLGGATVLAIALIGPVVAVWSFDAGERGMLGDAGANTAGALLGFVAAWECGRSWVALVVLGVLLAVNLASERWSFSVIIAHNRPLSWIDRLGRPPHDPAQANSAKSSPQSETSDG